MTKIVIMNNGQNVISKVSSILNSESNERLGYLLVDPMVILYYEEEGELKARLVPFSACSTNREFEVRVDSVLSFGDPLPGLVDNYLSLLPNEEPVELELSEEDS